MPPAKNIENTERGYVIPIGGAEEKTADAEILERFCSLSGSEKASIVIIPTASMLKDTGERYERIFKDLGVKKAISIPIDDRSDSNRSDYVEALENATGVFITGEISCAYQPFWAAHRLLEHCVVSMPKEYILPEHPLERQSCLNI